MRILNQHAVVPAGCQQCEAAAGLLGDRRKRQPIEPRGMGPDEARLEAEPLGGPQEVVRAGDLGGQSKVVPDGIGIRRFP